MTSRVLITRPLQEAQAWAQQLSQHGLLCEVLPLIEIAPAGDPHALHAARTSMDLWRAIMFVSANAVAYFFSGSAVTAEALRLSLAGTACRFWVTGGGTRAALLSRGVPAELVDAPPADTLQFDSEALWNVVKDQVQPAARVLLVRGADASGAPAGRDWLAQQLREAGASVQTVVAYRRLMPVWAEPQRVGAAQAASDGAIWLLSSSEAIANLHMLMPCQHWGDALALATHPRIAQAARDVGFGHVQVTRPSLDDVIASIKSMNAPH